MEKVTKNLNKIITNIVRILIVLIAIFLISQKEFKNLGILAITMLLTFYDKIVEKVLKIKLEDKLKISLIIFIFAAQCLGTVLGFYGKCLWWDTMLHTISGVIFFFVGEAIIKQMSNEKGKGELNNKIIIAFAVCFSLSTGVIWEIFEFFVDSLLGQNMQVAKGLIGQEAVMDTMIDLTSVTVGTIFISIVEILKNRKSKRH